MNVKQVVIALVGIVIVFAIGLVGFFMFSADKGDGLEKTMEDAGVSEGEPVYQAPLSYGEDYPTAFFAGIIGVMLTLGLAFLVLQIGKMGSREVKGEKSNDSS
ncbi:MAG: hypothetical protein QXT63_03620 [Thermoplasmata archaeon]